VFKEPNHVASDFRKAGSIETSIGSRTAFEQAIIWLEECDNYLDCPKRNPQVLPKRLIHISPSLSSNTVRLLITNGLVDHYAALSYCWEKAQKGVTTSRNFVRRPLHIDMDDL
jgi:hypothetical protein